jgi:1-acyl-sn-glycerol-3-phosphate acyltransferase
MKNIVSIQEKKDEKRKKIVNKSIEYLPPAKPKKTEQPLLNGKDTTAEAYTPQFDPMLELHLRRLEEKIEKHLNEVESRIKQQDFSEEKILKSVEERVKQIISSQSKSEQKESLSQITGWIKNISHLPVNLSSIFSLKTWVNFYRTISMWAISDEVDEFGRDRVFELKVKPFFDFLYDKWWRVETIGVNNVPSTGPVLLVSNHSGTLPFDGAMTKLAIWREHPAQRDIRPLVENFVYYFPIISIFMPRIGGVRASQENAERLLRKGEAVIVYPEGVKGVGKYFHERYKLQRFGRGGFIRLAMRTGAPIVPVAVVGAEEIYPLIARPVKLGRLFGVPYIPITPFFPWFGLLGIIPLPSKWYIQFGEPIDLSQYGPNAEDNDLLVNKLSEMVRGRIQNMLIELLKQRKSIWY